MYSFAEYIDGLLLNIIYIVKNENFNPNLTCSYQTLHTFLFKKFTLTQLELYTCQTKYLGCFLIDQKMGVNAT